MARSYWDRIKLNFGYRCAYCLKQTRLTQDHMIPRSKGGTKDPANIVPACEECNQRKSNRPIWEMILDAENM